MCCSDGRRFVLRYCFDQSTGKHLLFVFLNYTGIDSDSPLWSQLKSAIALLPQSWHLHLLFALASRKDMLHAATDVVSVLVGPGEVRYAVLRKEPVRENNDLLGWDYWYEATLDSEELKGAYGTLPSHATLIFLCRQRS